MSIQKTYTFSDVLLKPKYSEISSRADVSLKVKIKNFQFNHPIIPANMKTIVGLEMAKLNSKNKGLTLLHRFSTLEEQLEIFKAANQPKLVGLSIRY